MKLFWNTSWDLWNFCNGIEHNNTNGTKADQQRHIQQEIKIQWRLGAPANFQKMLFNESLSKVLSQPITTQQVWLLCIKAARTAFN
mmetsp:Transcript_4722/g.7319  ORF Transcript_4722/g.7319 Transcript_4722/m.7319 type:complete len:86 (+) Transcript_4722:1704-1961(+)